MGTDVYSTVYTFAMPSVLEAIAKENGKTVAEFYYATSPIWLIVNCYSNDGCLEIRGFFSPQMIIKVAFSAEKNHRKLFYFAKFTV